MGSRDAAGPAALSGAAVPRSPAGRGSLSSLAVGLAFFCGPIALVSLAVSARTAGFVDSREIVAARVRRFLPVAKLTSAAEGAPLALVLAVASVESSGLANVRSRSGAVGLMQLMPATADELAANRGEPTPTLTDPATSLRLGARYLARQLRAFATHGAAKDLALCAYNAGPGAVRRWVDEEPPPESPPLGTWIPARYGETRAYVRRVREWEAFWEAELRPRAGTVSPPRSAPAAVPGTPPR
ncbi:MAG: transglycosylase SLT domain-containing protein [Planctomycetes bacterium]|nr:transglycosylase SLT domain-containing protein [Planctomycetota bacterium]